MAKKYLILQTVFSGPNEMNCFVLYRLFNFIPADIIQIMHIREVVSKNYSPRGNFIKVWNTRLKAECVLDLYKVTEGG